MFGKVAGLCLLSLLVSCSGDSNEPEHVQIDEIGSKGDFSESSLKLFPEPADIVLSYVSGSDTIVSLPSGSAIYLPTDLFDISKGEKVKVQIKDISSYMHMLEAGVDCRSDEELLETSGMLWIVATDNKGDEVRIKEGSSYVLHFPKVEKRFEAQLFYGNVDDGGVNWQRDESSLLASNLEVIGWSYALPQVTSFRRMRLKDPAQGDYYDYVKHNLEYNQTDTKSLPPGGIGYLYCIDKETGSVYDFKFLEPKGLPIEEKIRKLYSNMPKMRYPIPDSIIHGRFCASESIGRVQSKPRYMSNEAYKNSFRTKYEQYEKLGIKNIQEAELKYYIFEANEIGWINCDRFVNWPNPRIQMAVEYEGVAYDSLDTYFIFANIKSMIQAYEEGATSTFYNLPEEVPGYVVTLAYNKGELLLNITDTKIQKEPIVIRQLEPVTLDYLEEKLIALEPKREETP